MPITPSQKQVAQQIQFAAAHDNSPQVRLVAGPGTGKSKAIEERVKWLIQSGTPIEGIHVASFTRAASRDLQQRIREYCLQNGVFEAHKIKATTLHALALRVLRISGKLAAYPTEPMIMDDWELKNIFDGEFSRIYGINATRCAEIRREHEAFWATGHWDPANYIVPDPPITTQERNSFNSFYGTRTQTYSCVLPGDIIRQCIDEMNAGNLDPVSLLNIQHLVVDEYQDLNPCDLEFIDYMINRGVKTFVAGDDDQSIYSFRFASPQGIQNFVSKNPASGDYQLSDCFRCTNSVVQAANALITNSSQSNRLPKTLTSLYANSTPPLEGRVLRWRFQTDSEENLAVVKSCRDLILAGVPAREIIVLLSNSQALGNELKKAFADLNVPYEMKGALGYQDTNGGRFALAMLRIVSNSDDYIAHRVILGLPKGVGIGTCVSIIAQVLVGNLNFKDVFYLPLPSGIFGARELTAINKVCQIAATLSEWSIDDTIGDRKQAIQGILNETLGDDAQQAWSENVNHLPEGMSIGEVLDYFRASSNEEEEKVLSSTYERLGLTPPVTNQTAVGVQIMTMHGAKGLSGQVVFIPGLEEEVFPGHRRNRYPGLIAEAARLLYVSISRARSTCVLSYSRKRFINGKMDNHSASRFASHVGGAFGNHPSDGMTATEISNVVHDCNNLF